MILNSYNFSLSNPKLIFFRILFLMIISSCNGCDEKRTSSIPMFDETKDNIKNLSIPKENQNSIQKQIIEQSGLYMILLYRNECKYCTAFIPKFKNLSNEYEEYNITFGGVLFSDEKSKKDQQKKLVNILYGIDIREFPCIVIIKDGKIKEIIQEEEEKRKKENLINLIESYIN